MSKEDFFKELDKKLSQVEREWLLDYFKDCYEGYSINRKFLNEENIVQHFIDTKYFKKLCIKFYDGILTNLNLAKKLYESIPEYHAVYDKLASLYTESNFNSSKETRNGLTYSEIWVFCDLINLGNRRLKQICRELEIFDNLIGCADMDLSHWYWMQCFKLSYEIIIDQRYRPEGEGAKEAKKDFEEQQSKQEG